MTLIFREPLSVAALDTLAAHKYQSGTYTVLDGLLNVWWEILVTWVPLWMAPNLITLLGTLAMLSTLVPMHVYMSYGLPVPAWVHLYTAACLFFYQSMDAIDGKQARRTGSSSPLGQLFDHGCDAFITGICVHNSLVALGLNPAAPEAVIIALSCLLLFYFSQWEEAFTHTLRTNAGGYGVSEGQLSMIILHLIAAAVSGGPAPPVTVSLAVAIGDTVHSIAASPLQLTVAAVILSTGMAAARSSSTWCAVVLANVPAAWTGLHFPLQAAHPHVVLLVYTLSVTLVATQTIVHSMARQPLTIADTAACYMLPTLLLLDALLPQLAPYRIYLALACLAAISVAYATFVAAAMQQISHRLNIHPFRITPKVQHAPSAVDATKPTGNGRAAAAVHEDVPAPRSQRSTRRASVSSKGKKA